MRPRLQRVAAALLVLLAAAGAARAASARKAGERVADAAAAAAAVPYLGDAQFEPDEAYWDTHDTVVNREDSFMEVFAPTEGGANQSSAAQPQQPPPRAENGTSADATGAGAQNASAGAGAGAGAGAAQNASQTPAETHNPVPEWPENERPDPSRGEVNGPQDFNAFPFPDTNQLPPGRVLPNTACAACRHLITGLATAVLDRSLDRVATVVESQKLCQWENDHSLLRVDCQDFEDMERWLERGGLLLREEDRLSAVAELGNAVTAKQNATNFCSLVGLCRASPSNVTHAAMVRFRTLVDLRAVPQSSLKWKLLVRAFLHQLAGGVGVSASRLQLHVQQGDALLEVIVRDRSDEDAAVASNPFDPETQGANGLDALQVANRIFRLFAQGGSLFANPSSLLSMIDTKQPVYVRTLTIPATKT